MDFEPLYNVKQAAQVAGVSVCLVYLWCQEGRLVHYRLGHKGTLFIPRAALQIFLGNYRPEHDGPNPNLE